MWNLCAKFSVSLDPDGEFDWKLLSNFLAWFTSTFLFRFYECVWHVRNSAAKCEVVGPNGRRNYAQVSDGEGETKEWTGYWPCKWKCKYFYRERGLFLSTANRRCPEKLTSIHGELGDSWTSFVLEVRMRLSDVSSGIAARRCDVLGNRSW